MVLILGNNGLNNYIVTEENASFRNLPFILLLIIS